MTDEGILNVIVRLNALRRRLQMVQKYLDIGSSRREFNVEQLQQVRERIDFSCAIFYSYILPFCVHHHLLFMNNIIIFN